jgi:Flp pilus assembly protein TadD
VDRSGIRTGLLAALSCLPLLACAGGDRAGSKSAANLSTDAQLRLAEAADVSGDKGLALSMYLAAAKNAPSDASVQLRSADALARQGQYVQAKRLLMERLQANPGQIDLTRGLALIDLVFGDQQQAIEMLDRILATKPNDVAALTDKGIALDLLRRHREAQALYRRALTIAPNDAVINNDLAMSIMLEGRVREAQQVLEPFSGDGTHRLVTNLSILRAANRHTDQARSPADGRSGDAEVLAIKALGRGNGRSDATP